MVGTQDSKKQEIRFLEYWKLTPPGHTHRPDSRRTEAARHWRHRVEFGENRVKWGENRVKWGENRVKWGGNRVRWGKNRVKWG